MKKEGLLAVLLGLLFPLLFFQSPISIEAALTVHNIDSGLDYTTIQDAIAANETLDGHTILVEAGIYYENLVVNKSLTLIGANRETTIIDGSHSNATFSPVIWISDEDEKSVKICNFTIRGSAKAWGIYILPPANAWIEQNIITNNSGGICACFSHDITLIENVIINNKGEGILFSGSSGNTMRNNTISGNTYNFGIEFSSIDHDIDTSNLVNGKPLYYLRNCSDLLINPVTFPNVGYLALINCDNVTIEKLNLTNNYNGLLLANVTNSAIRNNTFKTNVSGIDVLDATNNTLHGNNVTHSGRIGISLEHSPHNRFMMNRLVDNRLHFQVNGDHLDAFLQDLDSSNTVDGKVMRFHINHSDLVVNPSTIPNTGYLAFINCDNVTAEQFSLENNELLMAFTQNSTIRENTLIGGGVSLHYSSVVNVTNNVIMNGESGISIYHSNNVFTEANTIQNMSQGFRIQASSHTTIVSTNIIGNRYGIEVRDSSNNTISRSNITDNEDFGLILYNSDYNRIFHNNFINNAIPNFQAITSGKGNMWDNGYPSGGNYWSDYTERYPNATEIDNSGIWDTAYRIFGSPSIAWDRYPMIEIIPEFPTGTSLFLVLSFLTVAILISKKRVRGALRIDI